MKNHVAARCASDIAAQRISRAENVFATREDNIASLMRCMGGE